MYDEIDPNVFEYFVNVFERVDLIRQRIDKDIVARRAENDELAKMAGTMPDGRGRELLLGSLLENWKAIDEQNQYQQSDVGMANMIRSAEQSLKNDNPVLYVMFEKSKIGDQHKFLMEQFRGDLLGDMSLRVKAAKSRFRNAAEHLERNGNVTPSAKTMENVEHWVEEWHKHRLDIVCELDESKDRMERMLRYAKCGTLVSMDVNAAAKRRIEVCFPELAKAFAEEKAKEYARLLRDDPDTLYAAKLEEYAERYVAVLGDELNDAEKYLTESRIAFTEHEKNEVKVRIEVDVHHHGQEEWQKKHKELFDSVVQSTAEVSDLMGRREAAQTGLECKAVRKWVRSEIDRLHPELIKVFEDEECAQCYGWEEVNRARLAAQEARLKEREAGGDIETGKSSGVER